MKKILSFLSLSLCLFAPMVKADQAFTLMPYVSSLAYKDSATKDKGSITGAYLFWGMGLSNSLEIGAEKASFTSLTGTQTGQQNTAVYYTYYKSYSNKYRIGTHGVSGDDSDSDGGRMIGLGTTFSKYGVFSADIDWYRSSYGNYPLYSSTWSSLGSGLVVNQWTPQISFPFDYGKYSAGASMNLINLSAPAYKGDTSFTSTTLNAGIYRMRWATTLDLYSGKEAFAVRDSGFTLYNSPTVYKSGYKVEGTFYYSYQAHFFLSVASRTYEETAADAVASATTFKFKYAF
ncbi:MAG: hypothetical protein A2527_03665 [Candidatus Lambdaproteobacteria bacterium RIFOXYD2_FULL_50_16]|uniref:Autotransporter domain-containing protein n=1 Tax=Candidatus Lambdaproteobacteria bacterium RIFOXYD2_FULL_50_16 TaxID=1817772 RepID=A0A1F6GEX1_9PROT|nr:MAG: hypothetical protein A2527_03665 [Candidatus Lambdaproteobacteria bacterium RIFOXYD2_FULL_50_16]